MRKTTQQAINAFMSGTIFSSANTKVDIDNGVSKLYLFGNLIAKKDSNTISITNANHFTNTTKKRLNGIPGVSINQQKGIWYLNGEQWSGEWVTYNADKDGRKTNKTAAYVTFLLLIS
jgi:hypothetical protein